MSVDVDALAPDGSITACRSCGGQRPEPVLNLGSTPIANALVDPTKLPEVDPSFPLAITFCPECTLVQLAHPLPADAIFDEDYPYFSSFSDALMAHAAEHVAGLLRTRHLDQGSLAVETASNDGYLLRNFVAAGVRTLGIDPSPGPWRRRVRSASRPSVAFSASSKRSPSATSTARPTSSSPAT